ncbi:MAG: HAMP domain-containing sensor histidine kinase, partial [Fulvivirga sp.]|nr:HAMP domain-containing sensor histidine kinase [Fulvivirga sp.]
MSLKAFTDSFINAKHFSNAHDLRRARLFVRACLLTSLFSSTYIGLSVVFEFEKGIYFMTFNVLGFVVLAFLTKTRLSLLLLRNLYVLVGGIAVLALTYYSGGVWSAIYPWIISIPVLALLVANREAAIVWTIISFGAMIWMGVLAVNGVELPKEYDQSQHVEWYVSIVPGLLLMIMFISFVFESEQQNALNTVERKNKLLKSQTNTITEQSAELKKLIEEKEYIIRILAHDLRNPLKNIGSLLGLLKLEDDPDRQKEYVEVALTASSNADNLVKKVLELEASDDKNIHIEPVPVGEVIKDTIEALYKSAEKKKIKINVTNQSRSGVVHADRTYLALVMENLLSNAVKFSKNGQPISVEVSDKNEKIRIKVIDQGPGVAVEEQDKLFKTFSRLSARPTGGATSHSAPSSPRSTFPARFATGAEIMPVTASASGRSP